MFPFAHYFIAEEMFGKLNNEIKLGSIIPDFISLGPNITIEDTHKVLEDFGNPDFERAWNLHIIVDEYTEENYSLIIQFGIPVSITNLRCMTKI
jgi:hypothetical protein